MIYAALTLLGLALGSFTNALVWRLHEQEILRSKKGTKKRLAELSISKGRSMCPHCQHALAWYDLLPVASWLLLMGKCRYCRKSISAQYPLVELIFATVLPLTCYFWPYALKSPLELALFACWIIILLVFFALFIYDLHWMTLPNRLVYPLFGAVSVFSILRIGLEPITAINVLHALLNALLGAVVFGGLFWVIYQASSGTWIGGGDVRLGFALGILLGWQFSLLCLAVAAYLGCAIILVLVVLGKYHRKLKMPFGPLLILGAVFCMLWGQQIIDWYLRLSGV